LSFNANVLPIRSFMPLPSAPPSLKIERCALRGPSVMVAGHPATANAVVGRFVASLVQLFLTVGLTDYRKSFHIPELNYRNTLKGRKCLCVESVSVYAWKSTQPREIIGVSVYAWKSTKFSTIKIYHEVAPVV